MAKLAKIRVYRENSKNIKLNFNGLDITGAIVYLTVKTQADSSEDDSTALIAKDVSSHTNPTAGETVIKLLPTDTDIAPGEYNYDIKIKLTNGTQQTLGTQTFEILETYTNRA